MFIFYISKKLLAARVTFNSKILCSGRAGREGPGKCYRLYPENEFFKLKYSTTPEIKRCNLSNVILQLKALGIDDIVGFDFIEKPDRLFALYILSAFCPYICSSSLFAPWFWCFSHFFHLLHSIFIIVCLFKIVSVID